MKRAELAASLPEAVRKIVCTEPPFASEFRDDAGWYPVNSVIPDQVRPRFQSPGGGVGKDNLMTLSEALDICLGYAVQRVETAQRHLEKLREARRQLP